MRQWRGAGAVSQEQKKARGTQYQAAGGATHRHKLLRHVKHVFQRGGAARKALHQRSGRFLLQSSAVGGCRRGAADRERQAHADAALGFGAGHQLAA